MFRKCQIVLTTQGKILKPLRNRKTQFGLIVLMNEFNFYQSNYSGCEATIICSILLLQGSAWIDKCRPDLLITESTYATTIRDSKRCRERDFLKKVHDCVDKGGKVLIPVFALGRAQVRLI
jgi:predicted metal-dependent RNase